MRAVLTGIRIDRRCTCHCSKFAWAYLSAMCLNMLLEWCVSLFFCETPFRRPSNAWRRAVRDARLRLRAPRRHSNLAARLANDIFFVAGLPLQSSHPSWTQVKNDFSDASFLKLNQKLVKNISQMHAKQPKTPKGPTQIEALS
jgi:hypothetical protein